MPRNLDLTALRSFVTVAENGGVTRAAGFLNLTQSAVSMQLKRLEESLDVSLLDRSSRRIGLTVSGEQLLGYARRLLAMNDEVYSRLTDQAFEGEIVLGVPHDIVYPAIPSVLRRFNAEYPRMKVQLLSSNTRELKDLFSQGKCDIILTTENSCDPGGKALATLPLYWVGAPRGSAWKQRPLRLAFEVRCIFRGRVQKALDDAGIPWEMAIESHHSRTVEASISADLAVHAMIKGMAPPYTEVIQHCKALPDLGSIDINIYSANPTNSQPIDDMTDFVGHAFNRSALQVVA